MWPLDRLLRTLAALAILLLGTAAIVATDSDMVRYASPPGDRFCSADQLLRVPADADVLLVGSSRIRSGFGPGPLKAAIADDEVDKVFNLGRSTGSPYRNLAILTDLLARGVRPKIVAVEVLVDRMARDWEPPTYEAVSFLHYRDAVIATEQWWNGWRPPLVVEANVAFDKLSQGLDLLADRSVQRLALYRQTGKVPVVCERDALAKGSHRWERIKSQLERQLLGKDPNYLVGYNEAQPDPASRTYKREMWMVERVRSLAGKYKFKVVFVRLPSYLQQPYAPQSKQVISAAIPEFRFPPDELYRLPKNMYVDPHHVTPTGGRPIMSGWLGGVLKAELDRP